MTLLRTLRSNWRSRRFATVLAVAVACFATFLPRTARADGRAYLYYFYDPNCSVCHEVHDQVLEPLRSEYGDRLVVEERNIADTANFELLLDLEMHRGVLAGSIPEVFIGEDVLVGPDDIRARLKERVEHYLAQGGVALPEARGDLPPTAEAASPLQVDCELCDLVHGRGIAATPAPADEGPVVRAVLFWSETCPACHTVLGEVLPALYEQHRSELEVRAVNISTEIGLQLWRDLAARHGVPQDRMYVPMLVIDSKVMIGSDAIANLLPTFIEEYLAEGGIDWADADVLTDEVAPIYYPPVASPTAGAQVEPASPSAASAVASAPTQQAVPTIHAAYFFQPGCDECERAERDLAYIQEKYPQVQVEQFDVKEEALPNQYLCERAGVPAEKHLTAPAFFVGTGYLVGDQVRARAIEALIAPYLQAGAEEPGSDFEASKASAEQTIIERFRSLGLLTVVGAGLLDGVNPCAFATMIFLVSYLSLRKRRGTELLLTGAAFALGVFLTYLGVGFGFLRFLSSLPFLHVIGKWIYGVTAALCLALAWGSLADYRKAKEGRLEDMTLKLPNRMRGWTKTLIREGTGAKRFVLSSFALGFGVSIVELACTGQVYLPTIIFVLGIPEWRSQATLALLLYNVMFILPLVAIFLTVYFGTSSEQLIEWMQKHSAAVKLGMAVLFVLLAVWLVYSIVAL